MTANSMIFLQAAGGDPMQTLLFMGLIMVIFYFFMIRPQSKKQKAQRTFLEGLQKGDEIVLASGILGRISKIEDDIMTLEIGTKNFIRVTKNAVSKELTDAVFHPKENKK